MSKASHHFCLLQKSTHESGTLPAEEKTAFLLMHCGSDTSTVVSPADSRAHCSTLALLHGGSPGTQGRSQPGFHGSTKRHPVSMPNPFGNPSPSRSFAGSGGSRAYVSCTTGHASNMIGLKTARCNAPSGRGVCSDVKASIAVLSLGSTWRKSHCEKHCPSLKRWIHETQLIQRDSLRGTGRSLHCIGHVASSGDKSTMRRPPLRLGRVAKSALRRSSHIAEITRGLECASGYS